MPAVRYTAAAAEFCSGVQRWPARSGALFRLTDIKNGLRAQAVFSYISRHIPGVCFARTAVPRRRMASGVSSGGKPASPRSKNSRI